jgi:hypothetical protein
MQYKWGGKMAKGGETKDNYIQKLKELLKLYVKYRNDNKREDEDTTWRWLNIPSSVDLEGYGNLQLGSIEPLREDGIEVILHRYTKNYQNKIDKHFQYNFSTENKEKKEGTFGYHTYIYEPLTNDVAKSFYDVLIKDNKYLKTKMAKGGEMAKKPAKFKDKVKAISKSLESKKVPKRVRKDYGATYDKKESIDAAKRIAGSMAKKERKRYEI